MRLLGEGSTSNVYMVFKNRKQLAKKIFNNEENFNRELANWNYIMKYGLFPRCYISVPVEFSIQSKTIYFEYQECITLLEWKRQYVDKLDLLETIRVLMNVAESVLIVLSFMHKNNMYHNDVKDDNILITCNGIIKIIDFGQSLINTDDKMFQVNNDLRGLKKALYLRHSAKQYDTFLKKLPSTAEEQIKCDTSHLLEYVKQHRTSIEDDFVNNRCDCSFAYELI